MISPVRAGNAHVIFKGSLRASNSSMREVKVSMWRWMICMTSMMDRLENLLVLGGTLDNSTSITPRIDGCTPPLVNSSIDSLYHATFAEASVPSLLVEINAGGIDGIEGARVADVQFVGRNANDGA
jgi:hypothetical protein